MAVSLFSASHIAASGGTYEPQRANNGRLIIAGLPGDDNGGILVMSLSSFTIPKVVSNIIEIAYLNERRKVAGNPQYDNVSISYHDYVGDIGTARQLWQWRRQVHDPVTGQNGLARDYKKTGRIELIAPNGSIRVIRLVGVWPVMLDMGEINFQNDEAGMIQVELAIDKFYPTFAGIDDNSSDI